MKLNVFASLALFAAFGMIFFFAPEEQTQGIVQKIFYIHVACVLTMYLGFFIAFLSALLYLLEKKVSWDEISVSGAEVSFFLCTVVLMTGIVWAKPIWGVWWTWEPRLTSMLLLWLLYAAYLVLRGYFQGSSQGRTVSAIVAVIAFLDLPLIHFSVRLWRGVHPSVLRSKEGLPSSMTATLLVTFVAILLWFSVFLRARFRLERIRNRVARVQMERKES